MKRLSKRLIIIQLFLLGTVSAGKAVPVLPNVVAVQQHDDMPPPPPEGDFEPGHGPGGPQGQPPREGRPGMKPGEHPQESSSRPANPPRNETAGLSEPTGKHVAADTTGQLPVEADSLLADASEENVLADDYDVEDQGFRQALKTKFIEGNAGFMSLVAIALVVGLAFCIERMIYLTLSEIKAKKFMADLDAKIQAGDIEGAKEQCRETRGPVASICYQGLLRIHDSIENIERSVASYGTVQAANLEKGCSWITLFIAMAPSLGFLGTVIGMVMAFDNVQMAGDLNASVVAAGMKVALITTIFGIIVALILQLFYNYILSKIDHLTSQMEESAITLLDAIMKYKQDGSSSRLDGKA